MINTYINRKKFRRIKFRRKNFGEKRFVRIFENIGQKFRTILQILKKQKCDEKSHLKNIRLNIREITETEIIYDNTTNSLKCLQNKM